MSNLVRALQQAYIITMHDCYGSFVQNEWCDAQSKQLQTDNPEGLLEARRRKYITYASPRGWVLTPEGMNFYKQLQGDFS